MDTTRRAGELIYLEGEPAEHVWFVKSGAVVLSRSKHDTEGSARALRLAGSFVGLEMLVSAHYLDSARAATDVVICGSSRSGIDQWLGPKGTPARVALELTLRSQTRDGPRPNRTDGSAVQRVARWLADEGPRGVTLTLPRRVVAELLGMRAETLSRSLAQLHERGVVHAQRTSLRIIDGEALEAIAAGRSESATADERP